MYAEVHEIDEMCKCSEAGKVMFEKAFQGLKKYIQAKATKLVKRCNAAKISGPGKDVAQESEEDTRIGEQIALLKLQASWSDKQAHNTKVLVFIKDYVLVVISCSDSILQQSDSVCMPYNPLFNLSLIHI